MRKNKSTGTDLTTRSHATEFPKILSRQIFSIPTTIAMQVFVKTLSGQTVTCEVEFSETTRGLKDKICEMEG